MDEVSILKEPDKFYYVDKQGNFKDNIIENKRLENAQYWAGKTQQIGALMLVSMGVLCVILLVETDILNVFWSMLWG